MVPLPPQGSILQFRYTDHAGRSRRLLEPSLLPVLVWALLGILVVPEWTPIGSASLLKSNLTFGGGIVALATLLSPFESSTVRLRLRRTGNFVAGWLLLHTLWTGSWFAESLTSPEREQVVGVGFVVVAAAFASTFIIGLVRLLLPGGDR